MIRLEINGETYAEFVQSLGGFLSLLRVAQAPEPPTAKHAPSDNAAMDGAALQGSGEGDPPKDGEVLPPEPKRRGRPKKEPAQIDIEEKISEQAPSIADVRDALMLLLKHTDEKTSLDLVQSTAGTMKLKDVPVEKYQAVIDAAKAKIAEVTA